ncbi:molybdate transport system substrate-binding protein [Oceanisphaera litoralis]|uniref:molybdate ABC transporter substrate-binding protein n=1 Tax=Oceanisphaera litoralis TaxID=225144 RepID=UPI00195DFB33|nr:molybdate ABC transporter substrate-binding protein [Oceanisphaera litoralis]MBM7454827.1 molybdate transport system substrate-binding protein [Oceanisphaera litoralis]
MKHLFLLLGILGISPPLAADDIRVAVATNFIEVMEQLGDIFTEQSGHRVLMSSGATGKFYAQIKSGAPYDIFLAADELRPTLLEEEGVAIADSRFTYALGKLVLWSPDAEAIDEDLQVLKQQDFRFLSIANPRTAPYGRAAQQVLEKLGHWEAMQPRVVRGENIGQAYQYVYSRNARLGLVAKSQVFKDGVFADGSYWQVPEDWYDPIVQQAVLLKEGAAARGLLEYLRSPEAAAVIASYGYGVMADR